TWLAAKAITANVSGSITVSGTAATTSITAGGDLTFSAYGSIAITGGTLVSKGSQLALLADADRDNVGNVTVDNATLTIAGGTFRASGYDVTMGGSATISAGTQQITRYKP